MSGGTRSLQYQRGISSLLKRSKWYQYVISGSPKSYSISSRSNFHTRQCQFSTSQTRIQRQYPIASPSRSRRSITTIVHEGHCPGCGAKFQHQDDSKPGYLPPDLETKERPPSVHSQKTTSFPNTISTSTSTTPSTKFGETLSAADLKALLKVKSPKRVICQRCHKLKNYSQEMERSFPKDVGKYFAKLKKQSHGVIVYVVDIFDLSASWIPDILDLVGKNKPLLLVANKSDSLPEDVNTDRILSYLLIEGRKHGLPLEKESIHLVSARSGAGMYPLAQSIAEHRNSNVDDIYLVGRTNVGKSHIISSFWKLVGEGEKASVTISHTPGTTVEMVKIPLESMSDLFESRAKAHTSKGAFLVDTPGMMAENSILNLLNYEELRLVIPKNDMKPLTYDIGPGQTLFIGGLGRIDYVKGTENVMFTTFLSRMLPVHRCKTIRAEEIYEKHLGVNPKILFPPLGEERAKDFPKLEVAEELTIQGSSLRRSITDIVFPGIGWVAVTGDFGEAVVKVWTPNKLPILQRSPLLPFDYRKRRAKLSI